MMWLLIGVLGVGAVVTMALGLAKAAADGDRYEPRHAGPAGFGDPPERDFYGSMTLDGERGWRAGEPLPRIPYWPAGPRIEAGPDWREQTAADLAPEALDPCPPYCAPSCPDDVCRALGECQYSSGPGVVVPSRAPGPGQISMLPDQEQLEASPGQGDDLRILAGTSRGGAGESLYLLPAPTRLADTGDIYAAHRRADYEADLRERDEDVADWLAGRAVTWARLEIGALT